MQDDFFRLVGGEMMRFYNPNNRNNRKGKDKSINKWDQLMAHTGRGKQHPLNNQNETNSANVAVVAGTGLKRLVQLLQQLPVLLHKFLPSKPLQILMSSAIY